MAHVLNRLNRADELRALACLDAHPGETGRGRAPTRSAHRRAGPSASPYSEHAHLQSSNTSSQASDEHASPWSATAVSRQATRWVTHTCMHSP